MVDGDLISRASLLAGIAELKESPWYNFGKVDGTSPEGVEAIWHYGYLQRKEAVEIIEDICIKKEPAVLADNDWISVKDRLPDPETWVMVYIKYPSPVFEMERGIHKMSSIKKMFYDGKSFYCDFGTITHWQHLPEPPKGE